MLRHPVNPSTPQHELRLLAEALDYLALARYESTISAAYRDITNPKPLDFSQEMLQSGKKVHQARSPGSC